MFYVCIQRNLIAGGHQVGDAQTVDIPSAVGPGKDFQLPGCALIEILKHTQGFSFIEQFS